MSAIDRVLAANERFALDYDPKNLSPVPRRGLAVLTCMDTRLSRKSLGLEPQDAHIIRNAGGVVTEDAIRSLLVSHYILGTKEVMIINHTDCGLMKFTESALHEKIEGLAGLPPSDPVHFYAFQDVEANVREQLRRSEEHTSELQSRQYLVCRL